MSKVIRRLRAAVEFNRDPKDVSPEGVKFAWWPVYGWDHVTGQRRKLWLEKVIWFRPLGLVDEYFTYAGSEMEFRDKHGCYSWEFGK